MFTRVGLAPAHPSLTTREAVEHWRTTHADVASAIPGLRRYVQLHPALEDGRHLLGHPGFEVCALTGFDDRAAMDAGFASETYRDAVRADEAVLIDRDSFAVLLGESISSGTTVDDASAALVAFLRRRPGVPPSTIAERAAALLADDDVPGWEVVTGHEADEDHAEQLDGDVLVMTAFEEVDDARAWARDEAGWAALRRPLTDVVFGVERFVASPNRVV